MKPNSKRSKTESGTTRSAKSFELEPFMKLNSKRYETESGTQPRSIRDQNDPRIRLELVHETTSFWLFAKTWTSFRLLPSFIPIAAQFHPGIVR